MTPCLRYVYPLSDGILDFHLMANILETKASKVGLSMRRKPKPGAFQTFPLISTVERFESFLYLGSIASTKGKVTELDVNHRI